METATVSENPRYVVGSDNREYRRAQDYAEHDQDVYLFDTVAGTRKRWQRRCAVPIRGRRPAGFSWPLMARIGTRFPFPTAK